MVYTYTPYESHSVTPLKMSHLPTSTESQNSNVSVQIQIKPKSQFEFVPRDTEESDFLDLVRFRGVAFSVETVVHMLLKT